MRLLAALLLCTVAVALATTAPAKNNAKIATKDFLLKQKFLFEIVHRIENPLAFEEWITLGKELIVDRSNYVKFDKRMTNFYRAYQLGKLLPQVDFFGAMVPSHLQQAWGLFNLFYYAKDWATFQHNVCWARLHVNAGMFVYALNLAVSHRDDFQGLIMPQIYEIWPQHFFNAPFINRAKKFNYDVWSRQVMHEMEYSDIYYKRRTDLHAKPNYLKNWKLWQWWKLMGLADRWHAVDQSYVVRDGIEFVGDPKWTEAMREVKMFWMPVDYTRDLQVLNAESELSYYMEDVDRNAAWYYLHLESPGFLNSEDFDLHNSRHREWWLFAVRTLLARLKLERLSHGRGDIEAFSHLKMMGTGYNPQLISWNGLPFLQRYNNYEYRDYGFENSWKIPWPLYDEFYKTMDIGRPPLKNGTFDDLHTDCDIVHGLDSEIFQFFYHNLFMRLGYADYDQFYDVLPSVFLNFETMWRDPLFNMFIETKVGNINRCFITKIPPYSVDELQFKGVVVTDVELDELVTYFDYCDTDVSNLLNDKMRFVDGQYQWEQALYARQQRLNHKPFGFKLHATSDKAQQVVVRVFIGPKFNEHGRLIALHENRLNFVQFDEFEANLKAGDNIIERSSFNQLWTHGDRVSYTEMYRLVRLALEDKYDFPLNISAQHSLFSRRLTLPKGWTDGFPVQFCFMITPSTMKHEPYETTGMGSGMSYLDELSLGYPFDREIGDEEEFLVSNMYFKDTKIYHMNYVDKYARGYENYGNFDYDYWKAEDIKL